MAAVPPNMARTDPAELRAWLRERIEAIETGSGDAPPSISTGWTGIDAHLPGGGLRCGAIHEWFGVEEDQAHGTITSSRLQTWTPPLLILSHLARQASRSGDGAEQRLCIWIGSKVWPSLHAIANGGVEGAGERDALHHTLLIDPSTKADRLWAIDAALRCPGTAVIADGSSLDTAATRRLQLAAESSGSIGLLARPPHERGMLSVANTRWRVSHAPPLEGGRPVASTPRWRVELIRCKGVSSRLTQQGSGLTLERSDAGAVVAALPHLEHRPRAQAMAS